jgi:hypothetical protein
MLRAVAGHESRPAGAAITNARTGRHFHEYGWDNTTE